MYLLRVIPATRIPLPAPQVLTYFSARQLPTGSLVSVPIHKRKAAGVVIGCEKLNAQKMNIRKADFELRGLNKIISPEPVLSEQQIKLAQWISEYYYCSIGPGVKMMIPAKAQNSKLKAQNHNSKLKTNQSLILTPEISTAKKIFEQHNHEDAAIIHSSLTDKQYLENWHRIRDNEVSAIIGTRLALFAPFTNLKEIIIEDEHSASYKSQQTPRIHARETAIKLAELWNAKIIFKSNTPSIEASWLAENKKINLQKPFTSHQPQATSIIDLRDELKEGNFSIFSRELQKKIKNTLDKKQQTSYNNKLCTGQVILFINRRGASTVLMCRDCGYVPKCQNCDVPLVYHLMPLQFRCHHCGHSEIPPVLCPNCLGTRIKFFGAGTQKVEIEFKKLFPETNVARLDSDISKTEKTGQKILDDFETSETQVLIGTQMILNKNLKPAPLVSLMLADVLLHLPDFRSSERTFQLISQLKNISAKDFILQTYSPENPAIQLAVKNDYKSFYHSEIQTRKELSYPPFSQLIKLIYQHKNAKKAEEEAKILAEKLKQQIIFVEKTSKLQTYKLTAILGPSPAFISKIGGKYIWQIILKFTLSPVEGPNLKLRNKILQIISPDWVVDVDPLQII